jgi:hypothetical protein
MTATQHDLVYAVSANAVVVIRANFIVGAGGAPLARLMMLALSIDDHHSDCQSVLTFEFKYQA